MFVLALIGVVFTLPAGDAVNQRDPVQIKVSENLYIKRLISFINQTQISSEEEAAALIKNENLTPVLQQDLDASLDPESLSTKDENLEPSETFGFGYGIGYGGWGGGYRRYGGYGYGGYGGYGGRGKFLGFFVNCELIKIWYISRIRMGTRLWWIWWKWLGTRLWWTQVGRLLLVNKCISTLKNRNKCEKLKFCVIFF